jgi:hypothetical protein
MSFTVESKLVLYYVYQARTPSLPSLSLPHSSFSYLGETRTPTPTLTLSLSSLPSPLFVPLLLSHRPSSSLSSLTTPPHSLTTVLGRERERRGSLWLIQFQSLSVPSPFPLFEERRGKWGRRFRDNASRRHLLKILSREMCLLVCV